MVPRAEIVAADEDMPLAELVSLFRDAKHSRLPVYRENLDDPTGLVHVKDVLALAASPTARRRLSPGEFVDRAHQAADPVRAALHARARSACSRCRPATPIWRW